MVVPGLNISLSGLFSSSDTASSRGKCRADPDHPHLLDQLPGCVNIHPGNIRASGRPGGHPAWRWPVRG